MDGGGSGDEKEEAVTGTDKRTQSKRLQNSERATAATKSRNYSHRSPNGSTTVREPLNANQGDVSRQRPQRNCGIIPTGAQMGALWEPLNEPQIRGT
jgi:hypothetical protein